MNSGPSTPNSSASAAASATAHSVVSRAAAVSPSRSARGGPDYLPLLRRELLQVIHKYLEVDPDTVQMNLERSEGHEVLELSVALPQRPRS